ncbi:unnamed protein product [Musa textilis]
MIRAQNISGILWKILNKDVYPPLLSLCKTRNPMRSLVVLFLFYSYSLALVLGCPKQVVGLMAAFPLSFSTGLLKALYFYMDEKGLLPTDEESRRGPNKHH